MLWSWRKRVNPHSNSESNYIYIWESDLNTLAYVNLQCVWAAVAIGTIIPNSLLSIESSHIKTISLDSYGIAGRIRATTFVNITIHKDADTQQTAIPATCAFKRMAAGGRLETVTTQFLRIQSELMSLGSCSPDMKPVYIKLIIGEVNARLYTDQLYAALRR